MIKYLSDNITDFFYSNNIIEEEDKEIYVYGLQLIISTIIGITLILVLGLRLNKLWGFLERIILKKVSKFEIIIANKAYDNREDAGKIIIRQCNVD